MAKATVFRHKTPDDSAGFLLWKITSLWQQKLSDVLGKFDINQVQFAIMASLKWFEEHGERTTQTHISEYAKIEKMTVSKSIRKLEEKNLIARRKSNTDARAINVEFTKRGRKIVNQAIIAIETADDEFFMNLSEDELKKYKSLTISIIKD